MSIQPSRKEYFFKTGAIIVLGLSGSVLIHALIRLVSEAPTAIDWELLGSAFPIITAPLVWIAKRSITLGLEFASLKERVKKLEERDEEWKTQKNEHNWLKVRLDHHDTRLEDLEE